MKRLRFKASVVVAMLLVFAIESLPCLSSASQLTDATRVLSGRCMSCHDTETREGGIDLTPLLQKRNLSEEKIAKDIDRDYWLSAEEAIEYGLVSRIVTSQNEL